MGFSRWVYPVKNFSELNPKKRRAGLAKHEPTLKSLSKILLAATAEETQCPKETQKSSTWLGNRTNLKGKSLGIGEKLGAV